MPTDDRKRRNCMKVCFTDRELVDLGRICAHENRAPAEMVWVMSRRAMYGSLANLPVDEEGTQGD